MTRNELISKLLLLGFKRYQGKSILRYKNIIDINVHNYKNTMYYSTALSNTHDYSAPIDNNSLPAIIKFIEDNSNDS